jgi:hypothetical protein
VAIRHDMPGSRRLKYSAAQSSNLLLPGADGRLCHADCLVLGSNLTRCTSPAVPSPTARRLVARLEPLALE